MNEVELLKQLEQYNQSLKENKIHSWTPIPAQMNFFNSKKSKKAVIAGNRCGKTKATLFELSCHLTGLYPKWWQGRKYRRPVKAWLIGRVWASLRDTIQVDLFGESDNLGTGFIPKSHIVGDPIVKSGMKGIYEKVFIKNVFGGNSVLRLWSGEQDREDFQAAEIDILVEDEELKDEIHNECMQRLATSIAKGEGLALFSFTPLRGQTTLWKSLTSDPNADVFSISMYDVPWLNEEAIREITFGLTDMEARARIFGIPSVGAGQIFQFEQSQYACDSFEIPSYWPRIGGLDIGRNHPTGAVALAWDRESNSIYAYQEYKHKATDPHEIVSTLKHWKVPFATSHDAFNDTLAGNVANVFKKEGLEVFSAGRDPWARIEKARNYIGQGRLWIFKDRCPYLIEEMRTYHTKDDGVSIYKIGEDVIDAFLHAVQFHDRAKLKDAYANTSITPWVRSSDGYY